MKSSELTFRAVPKDRLYYDQWQYSMMFDMDEASCLRELDHESIDRTLNGRQRWRQITQQRWLRGQTILTNSVKFQEITQQTSDDLHAVAHILLTTLHKFKIVVSLNRVWIYANDTDLLKQINDLPCVRCENFTRAVIVKPRNTVLLKNPKHTHRSYLNLRKLTQNEKQNLENFFQNHLNTLRMSPALGDWFFAPMMRCQDYFFFDHDGLGWTTMLNLIRPGLIRKTLPIQQAK